LVLEYLPKATNVKEFVQVAEIIFLLLEFDSSSITQWNIENTLGTITVLLSRSDRRPAAYSPKSSYKWACKLIEIVLRKHRIRLEGRYHLLVPALQTLLRRLCSDHPISRQRADGAVLAQYFTRLITLVCEPTAGAVPRAQQDNTLESVTDIAKRSAGRHMYLVLEAYVQLLLEGDVSNAVRDAIEPGMNAIFDITSAEVRRIMNDGMNESGRAVLRELFGMYTKFGKWTGV
jgi:nucleolar pre-ribosomal-associated protein 2